MQLRADIQLQSMIKSMQDVVLPAINPDNSLAMEQAQLVVAMLGLMQQRMPLSFRFDCDELGRLLGLAGELPGAVSGGAQTRAALETLAAAHTVSADVLARAQADPEEVQNAVRELRADVGALVQAVFTDGDEPSRSAVESQVLNASAEQLLRERAWLIGQGWEPDPEAIPPVEDLLQPVGGAKV